MWAGRMHLFFMHEGSINEPSDEELQKHVIKLSNTLYFTAAQCNLSGFICTQNQ